MRFFKRGAGSDPAQAIAAFWAWWSAARDRVAVGIDEGAAASFVDEISANVRAIDARLAWELSKGAVARHALVVSPEGDPAVRALALRWRDGAPPVDETWEYHASRQAGPLGSLSIGGVTVDLAEYRGIASWDASRERLDVHLWHPITATAPNGLAMQAAYLFLDNLLGEDDVERWIGTIDLLDAPTNGRTPDELRAEVARRATEATGQAWALAEVTDGGPAIVLANVATKPIDHPFHGHHVLVTVDRGLERLSQSPELQELDAAEDRLVDSMTGAGSVYVGHITDRRRRRIHFVASDPDGARDIATAWAEVESGFGPKVEVKPDPGWTFRRDLGL